MAEICSFCKREVTNNVCCDYCGTPVIFSDTDVIEEKNNVEEKNNEQTLNILDKVDKNEQNFTEEENSCDDIKINIYNSDKPKETSESDFDGGTTKVIKTSSIKEALMEEDNVSKSDEAEVSECDEYENEEVVLQHENDKDENNTDTYHDQEDVESKPNTQKSSENTGMRVVGSENSSNKKGITKGDLKLSRFLKNLLGVMFLMGLVSLFFPVLSPTELTDSLSFSIIDIVLLIATFVGMCLSFFEKKGIRKFIYGIIFSIIFLIVNIVIVRPFPPENAKETAVLLYLAIMFVISVIGHSSDRHTAFEKIQIWFDSFNFVVFFINLFVISVSVMVWFVMPDNMIEGIKPYLIGIVAISVVAIVAIFLMFKRKIAGANLFMLTAILTIILSMVAYHNIMNTIGYYNSVINLMNVIGSYYSKFIAILVAFPIIMFLSLSALNKKSGEVRR